MVNNFSPSDHAKRMWPHAEKIIKHFESKGIVCNLEESGDLHNVVFTDKSEKQIKISHHSFFRFSGIAVVSRDLGEKNQTEYVEVTDADYMNNFMKPIIEVLLNGPKK